MDALKHWALQVLIAIDQLGTAIVGGWADETLSAYAYRMEAERKPWGFTRAWIDAIFSFAFGQTNHCADAYLDEINRRQLPPSYR